jgi:uncharacterized protein with HEPN domain
LNSRMDCAMQMNLEKTVELTWQLPVVWKLLVRQRVKSEHPEIPWREVASLRNIIAHEYFGLDNEIVWDVIQTQIPDMIEKFQGLKTE